MASKPGTANDVKETGPTNASAFGTPANEPPPFFPTLIERARQLSTAPARPSSVDLPVSVRDIAWEQYRKISFRPERALWHGEPGHFEAQFFHMGYGYRDPVPVFVIEGQDAKPFAYSSDQFDFGGGIAPPSAQEAAQLSFAGMRLHANINRDDYRDEFMLFQGASYFRGVGKGGWLGLSGRGLAINQGLSEPEQFPRFSEMYLQKPGPDDKYLWVLALLEGKSVTGAYAMRIQPGDFTTVEISAQIFLREAVQVFAVAPLTSMFLYGEEHPANFGDFRPEVHDSDTLVMIDGNGDTIARPLHNPPRTTVSAFGLTSPKGFGLEQRDRVWDHYQDIVERYDIRPTGWVEPLGDWGRGAVRLFEFSSHLESDDNIAAYWVPEKIENNQFAVKYRVYFGDRLPFTPALGRVIGTRHASWEPARSRFVVDFANLPKEAENAEVTLDATVNNGRLAEQKLLKNPYTGGYRVEIDAVREQSDDIEMRVTLRSGGRPVTETWSYLWQPTR
ncbi:MAG TPA: glucan biosynthesis protein G [Polyangiales bacterium]|nr:glucan biosynthesis protein G [Polyangiales bacterium]